MSRSLRPEARRRRRGACRRGDAPDLPEGSSRLDLPDYPAINEISRTYFPGSHPARYCIRADLVKPEFLVEVPATAHLSGPR